METKSHSLSPLPFFRLYKPCPYALRLACRAIFMLYCDDGWLNFLGLPGRSLGFLQVDSELNSRLFLASDIFQINNSAASDGVSDGKLLTPQGAGN